MKFLQSPLNVVVTAGGSGIGKSIAQAFSNEGCTVFIGDIDVDALSSMKTELPEIQCRQVDVADAEAKPLRLITFK